MAFSINDAFNRAIAENQNRIKNFNPFWQTYTKIYKDKTQGLRVVSNANAGALASWNGSASITAADVGTRHFAEHTRTQVAKRVPITSNDRDLKPDVVMEAVSQLTDSVTYALSALPFTALTSALSDTYTYYTGTLGDTGSIATKAYFATNHVITGAGSQSNKLTSALDADSLAEAKALLRKWKNFEGMYMGAGQGPLLLVVHPDLEKTARELTESDTAVTIVSAADTAVTGASINVNKGIQTEATPLLSDANDWFLIDVNCQALGVWISGDPIYEMGVDPDTQILTVSCSLAAKAFVHPFPAGIVGSAVA